MAIVKKYPAKVIAIHNTIEGVYTLELESMSKPFKFAPGQFLHLAIDEYDPTGQWPESRCFSMQSSPDEQNIKITYAVKGQFTKRMYTQLKPGSEVTLKLPYGDLFTQPHNKENTIFIAGGTGITPFISLFTHASFSQYSVPKLYLGFKSETYNLYSKELSALNQSLILKIFYEDREGVLDIYKIFAENGLNKTYIISGPPDMIRFFKFKLIDFGVPEANIISDDWS